MAAVVTMSARRHASAVACDTAPESLRPEASNASLRTLMGALLLVLLGACSTATDIARAEARDRAEMTAALEASAASWNRADLTGHLAIYDESVTVMTRQGPRPTIAAIEAAFSAAYFKDGKPRQALGFEHATIRMLSRDSALMTGRFTLSGGGLPDQSGWFTLVWLRTPRGWRVVHDHTS